MIWKFWKDTKRKKIKKSMKIETNHWFFFDFRMHLEFRIHPKIKIEFSRFKRIYLKDHFLRFCFYRELLLEIFLRLTKIMKNCFQICLAIKRLMFRFYSLRCCAKNRNKHLFVLKKILIYYFMEYLKIQIIFFAFDLKYRYVFHYRNINHL